MTIIINAAASVLIVSLCIWLWRVWQIGSTERPIGPKNENSNVQRFFNFKLVELVRMGTGSARIVEITRQRLRYIDDRGADAFVDLEDCARIYLTLESAGLFPPNDETDWTALAVANLQFSNLDVSLSGCVGLRGALDSPPWFQFLDRRRTQFEFKDGEALRAQLRHPLAAVGWQTWDAS